MKGPAPSAATATTATTTTADWLEVVGDKVRGKAVLLEGRFDGADAEQEAKAQVALLAQHGAAAVLFADPAAPHGGDVGEMEAGNARDRFDFFY